MASKTKNAKQNKNMILPVVIFNIVFPVTTKNILLKTALPNNKNKNVLTFRDLSERQF